MFIFLGSINIHYTDLAANKSACDHVRQLGTDPKHAGCQGVSPVLPNNKSLPEARSEKRFLIQTSNSPWFLVTKNIFNKKRRKSKEMDIPAKTQELRRNREEQTNLD